VPANYCISYCLKVILELNLFSPFSGYLLSVCCRPVIFNFKDGLVISFRLRQFIIVEAYHHHLLFGTFAILQEISFVVYSVCCAWKQVRINFGLNDRWVLSLVSAICWVIAETKLQTGQSPSPNEKIDFTLRWSSVSFRILDSDQRLIQKVKSPIVGYIGCNCGDVEHTKYVFLYVYHRKIFLGGLSWDTTDGRYLCVYRCIDLQNRNTVLLVVDISSALGVGKLNGAPRWHSEQPRAKFWWSSLIAPVLEICNSVVRVAECL